MRSPSFLPRALAPVVLVSAFGLQACGRSAATPPMPHSPAGTLELADERGAVLSFPPSWSHQGAYFARDLPADGSFASLRSAVGEPSVPADVAGAPPAAILTASPVPDGSLAMKSADRGSAGLPPLPDLTLVGGGGGGADAPLRELTFMTRNLYYGADFDPVVAAALAGDPGALVTAVTKAWKNVEATDFAKRARALADEIEIARPDLLGLQEVALYRSQPASDAFGPEPTPATAVALDFLEILLTTLSARGLEYEVVASVASIDAEFPRIGGDGVTLQDLRLTDRDVLLARAGLSREGVVLSNARSGLYEAAVPIADGLDLPNGWVSVDVALGGRSIRVVSTQLAADFEDLQRAQAEELLADLEARPAGMDAVVVGDFNSDALGGGGRNATGTYADVLAAGLVDAWPLAEPGAPGATWGRDPLLEDAPAPFTERIDYVFFQGPLAVVRADLLGESAADRPHDRKPSDHAGVAVTLRVP